MIIVICNFFKNRLYKLLKNIFQTLQAIRMYLVQQKRMCRIAVWLLKYLNKIYLQFANCK